MPARSVLLTVSDTAQVVQSSAAMNIAPAVIPEAPVGFAVDPSFSAVPLLQQSATQTQITMSTGSLIANKIGQHAYVIRGFIDDHNLDAAMKATALPDGSSRLFADAEIAGMPICGGDPPLGTALDVKRLLGAGRLIQQKMDGSDVALAIVDTGINLPYLQSKGLQP